MVNINSLKERDCFLNYFRFKCFLFLFFYFKSLGNAINGKIDNKAFYEEREYLVTPLGTNHIEDSKLKELENLRNFQFPVKEEKIEDDGDKYKLVSKKLLDDFVSCIEILKKIHEHDLDFDKLKDIINSNPLANGKFFPKNIIKDLLFNYQIKSSFDKFLIFDNFLLY